jgi:hypothetical protein
LEDYFAQQRLRRQARQAEWDQTEMMNTMRGIESNLDQIRLQQQQAEWNRQRQQSQWQQQERLREWQRSMPGYKASD